MQAAVYQHSSCGLRTHPSPINSPWIPKTLLLSRCSYHRRASSTAAAFHSSSAPSPFTTVAAAEPFAAPDPFLPLSSIADMRQQANTNLDGLFSASPFSTMRRYDDFFEQMDPFGGSGFSDLRRLEDRMQQQMREMDSQFDKAFADMDRAQQQMDAEIQRGLRQLQEQQPGVRIERREEKSPGSYRYYESIQIRSGTSFTTLTPAHSTPFLNPLLLVAVVLAGAYAAVTAAFARNYDLTLYSDKEKWKLLLLWPVLALTSKPFRKQFSTVLRGEKVRVQEDMDGRSSSSSSSRGGGST